MRAAALVIIAAAIAVSQAEHDLIQKRAGGRAFIPIEERGGGRAFFNDEKRGVAPQYDNEDPRAFFVDKRGGGRSFNDFKQGESEPGSKFTKREGRASDDYKRGGARSFAPVERRGGARLFTTTKRDAQGSSPILQRSAMREFIGNDKGMGLSHKSGEEWTLEKRGGARMFRGAKRDFMDEYPDWLMYEDTPSFDADRQALSLSE